GGGPGGGLAQIFGAIGENSDEGIRVTRIFPDRAADKARLEEGDLITLVDGTKLTEMQQLTDLVRDKKEGDKITLQVSRGEGDKKETKEIVVVLELPGSNRLRPWTFMYAGQQPNIQ